MLFEKSCGGVVFTRKNGEILYVVIRSTGGDYGFPKGHMEPGEDEHTTALREIREEVGLDVSFQNGFREENVYPLPNKPGVTKQVIFFLAEFSGQVLRHQPEELTGVYLMPYEEALRVLTFAASKEILIKADKFLHQ